MSEDGAIRESNSPFSSNVVLVRKPDGSLRLWIDLRKLNSRTVKDSFYLPRMITLLDYWQSDRYKTAFSLGPLGFYECNQRICGFLETLETRGEVHGWVTSKRMFDRWYYYLLQDRRWPFGTVKIGFTKLKKNGLKLRGNKSKFFKRGKVFWVHCVSRRY